MEKFISEDSLTIFVLTTSLGDRNYGMVATWITPASLRNDELRFTVALSKFNDTTKAILKRKIFLLHKLPANEYRIALIMGLYHSESYNKFSGSPFSYDDNKIPLLDNAHSLGEAELISYLETEDRFIAYCRVKKIRNLRIGTEALTLKSFLSHLNEEESKLLQEKHLESIEKDTNAKS